MELILTAMMQEDIDQLQRQFYCSGELVRCRDCQFHYVGENEVDAWDRCRLHSINTEPDNYCSWAVVRGKG